MSDTLRTMTIRGAERFPITIPSISTGSSHTPQHTVSAAATRNANSIIINRSSRSIRMLKSQDSVQPAAKPVSAPRSAPPPEPTYHMDYIDELAFAEKSKLRAKALQDKENARQAKIDAELRRKFMTGGRKAPAPTFEGTTGPSDEYAFYDRQEQTAKHRVESCEQARLEQEYKEFPDKKVCRTCGTVQSFAEYQGRVKRCPKDGTLYRPKSTWDEVQESFLGRWAQFNEDRNNRLKNLEKELRPPFRITHKDVFVPETGSCETQEIPLQSWNDVSEEFLQRQAEVVERLEMAREEARRIRDKEFERHAPKPTPFKFTKPLPDFFTRQEIAAQRRNMSYEERLEEFMDSA